MLASLLAAMVSALGRALIAIVMGTEHPASMFIEIGSSWSAVSLWKVTANLRKGRRGSGDAC